MCSLLNMSSPTILLLLLLVLTPQCFLITPLLSTMMILLYLPPQHTFLIITFQPPYLPHLLLPPQLHQLYLPHPQLSPPHYHQEDLPEYDTSLRNIMIILVSHLLLCLTLHPLHSLPHSPPLPTHFPIIFLILTSLLPTQLISPPLPSIPFPQHSSKLFNLTPGVKLCSMK